MKKGIVIMTVLAAALLAYVFAQAAATRNPAAAQDAAAPQAGAPTAAQAPEPMVLATFEDRLSYVIGLQVGSNIGREFQMLGIDLDEAVMIRGLTDGLNEAQPLMTERQVEEVMAELQQTVAANQEQIRERQTAALREMAVKNLAEAQAFLAENGAREGVVTLPSGLQYEIIEEGQGESPTAASVVQVHYAGTLIDGTEFDSSYRRGEPVEFPVTGVIAGWTEALQLMKVGAKWRLYIPPALGYGESGYGRQIPPNTLLIFDVELLGIDEDFEEPEMDAAE